MTLTPARRRAALALRLAAVVPCLLALPVFALAGWTLWGWGLSAALLAANIVIGFAIDLVGRGRSQVTVVGLMGLSLLARAWLTFGVLFVVAATVNREVGLLAAAAFLVYFTVDMVGRSLAHVLSRDDGPAAAPTGGSE